MRQVKHGVARPDARFGTLLLPTVVISVLLAAFGVAAAQTATATLPVLYRLDKLRDVLGPEFDSPASRLRLQLALDLRRLI